MRRPRTAPASAVVVLLALVVVPGFPEPAPQAQSREPPVDTSGLAPSPYATMETLYERTIFRLDVLRLVVRFGPETAEGLDRVVRGRPYSEALADSVTALALESRDALVVTRFLRDVGLDRWMEGILENLDRARAAGLLELGEEELDERMAVLRERYAPLAERGLRDGDAVWYRVRGDTLEVAVEARDGTLLLTDRPVGSSHRRSVLGGYLAPGSGFREGLIRSLFPGGG